MPEGTPYPFPLDPREYTSRMREFLPSRTSIMDEAIERILAIADTCGFSEDDKTDLQIVLREALANAIIHGNKEVEKTPFFLRVYASKPAGLLILVRDHGNGFNPEDIPDPRKDDRLHLHHGRGLFLMRNLMDYVEYRRGGRELLLYKSSPS